MRKNLSLFTFELKMFFKNVINIIFVLIFPSCMILLFGNIYGNNANEMFGGFGTVDIMIPGYICLIVAVTGLMSLPITLCTYRENKVLKRLRATTLTPLSIIGTQFAVNFIMTLVGIALLIVISLIAFNFELIGSVLIVMLLTILVVCSIFSIGLLIASIFKSSKTATTIAMMLYFPMIFLSGATMPIELMPDTVQKWANVLPLTHAVKVLKSAWLNKPFSDYSISFIVLISIFIVCSLLSVKCFKWE